jgi:phosphoglycerate dehydrogenase-like enzyme
MMVERILVVGPKDCLAMVDDLAPKGFEIIKAPSNSPEAISALPGAHYLVGFVQQMVSEQLYKAAPHLRLVQCLSAGYDQADLAAARRSKIPVVQQRRRQFRRRFRARAAIDALGFAAAH